MPATKLQQSVAAGPDPVHLDLEIVEKNQESSEPHSPRRWSTLNQIRTIFSPRDANCLWRVKVNIESPLALIDAIGWPSPWLPIVADE